MGLSDKLKKQGNPQTEAPKQQAPKQPSGVYNNLSKQELEFLIRIIGDSNFKGKDLMFIYDLVKKLQDMYVGSK